MRSYLQHGRRHAPGGSDPIPNIGAGLPIASAFSSFTGVTITGDNNSHYISLQDGVNSAGFSTTDSSVFSNGHTSIFTGSSVYGIEIDAPGTYAVFVNGFTKSGGTAGKIVTIYWAASDGSSPSFFQQGRSGATLSDTWDQGQSGIGPHLFTHEWMTVAGAQTPAVIVPWASIQTGLDVVVNVQIMVVQLSPSTLSKIH